MPRRLVPTIALLLLATTLACAAEHVLIEEFQPFTFSHGDAVGDTLANTQVGAQRALDVTRLAGRVEETSLVVELTFSTPVKPWTAQVVGSVDGFVDLDLDENSATGVPGAANEFGGDAPLGSDFYLSLRDTGTPGTGVSLVRTSDYRFESVPATWSGNVLRVTIPRRLLPDTDGQFRASVVVEHPQRAATDFAPSTGFYVVRR